MLKKVFITIVLATTLGLLMSRSYAMQLNVSLGDDIKNNKDKISVAYDIYYNVTDASQKHIAQQASGIPIEKFTIFTALFNDAYVDVQPVDSLDGNHSHMTFGYIKDGLEIFPSSCQNIVAKPIMNVQLDENGCIVN